MRKTVIAAVTALSLAGAAGGAALAFGQSMPPPPANGPGMNVPRLPARVPTVHVPGCTACGACGCSTVPLCPVHSPCSIAESIASLGRRTCR